MPAIPAKLTLISHNLCPYVQRAAITLAHKGLAFERVYINLSNKPDWFLRVSPLGKTPVLLVDGRPIFESTVICEYLEDVYAPALHPHDTLQRAQHRAWMEFGSNILNNIAGFYSATDGTALLVRSNELTAKFLLLEAELAQRSPTGPFFDGEKFSLVDAVFGPIFRYFDVFEKIDSFGFFLDAPCVLAWRKLLAKHTCVMNAVDTDYEANLQNFLKLKHSALSKKMAI